jgi:hypothetical protein
MKILGLGFYALSCCVAAAMLAGCGGSQAPIGAPGAMPQTSAIATRAERGKSWMKSEASSRVLIYATGGCGGTFVFAYSDGTLVGSLDTGATSYGDCSDANGNVFITSGTTVIEYAHGGTSPINTLSLPGDEAHSCSVDPTTNDLAVAFEGKGGDIAIFQNEQGSPSMYQSTLDSSYCGYDASDNLFVDGYYGSGYIGLSELPKGSSTFTRLTINGTLDDPPAQVQWDGQHVGYESTGKNSATVQRLSISGSTATVVHAVHLRRVTHRATQSWIYKNVIVAAFYTASKGKSANKVGIWRYPAGGRPVVEYSYTRYDDPVFQAVTVSAGP